MIKRPLEMRFKGLKHDSNLFLYFYSKVPAFLNVVDIAGLVKGAHAGQGLGNAFLSHISACDGIFHMTRELFDALRTKMISQNEETTTNVCKAFDAVWGSDSMSSIWSCRDLQSDLTQQMI